MLTSAFSQERFGHLVVNMLILYWFGPELVALMGARKFLALYLGGAVSSSAFTIALPFVASSTPDGPVHGASGAVNATLAASILKWPTRTILVYMIVPMPAWICGGLYLAWDVYGAN